VALSKALGALEEAVGSDDSSEALMLLGRALLLSGDDELAERMLQQASTTFPVDPQAFYYFAEVSERRGHRDAARRALLDYETLEGDELDQRRRASLALRVADLSLQLSDGPAAVAWYQRAASMNSFDAQQLLRMAEAQALAGDVEGARATVARAIEKDPSSRPARQLERRLSGR
jgi:tetratricopeptide (TPR) repeat protein